MVNRTNHTRGTYRARYATEAPLRLAKNRQHAKWVQQGLRAPIRARGSCAARPHYLHIWTMPTVRDRRAMDRMMWTRPMNIATDCEILVINNNGIHLPTRSLQGCLCWEQKKHKTFSLLQLG